MLSSSSVFTRGTPRHSRYSTVYLLYVYCMSTVCNHIPNGKVVLLKDSSVIAHRKNTTCVLRYRRGWLKPGVAFKHSRTLYESRESLTVVNVPTPLNPNGPGRRSERDALTSVSA